MFHNQTTYSVGTNPMLVTVADVNQDNKLDTLKQSIHLEVVHIPYPSQM